MPHSPSADAAQFRALAQRLKDAGEGGLRRELYKAIGDAMAPLAAELKDPGHLDPYMPNRYAGVLARDLRTQVSRRASGETGSVTLRVTAPTAGRGGGRKVTQREEGLLWHPVFPTGPRRSWNWAFQVRGMMPGFFSDAVRSHSADIRAAISAAMHATAEKITKG